MRKIVSLIILSFFILPYDVDAQCAMCRAALESNTDNGTAEAINDGIVYLMAFPYLLMGGLGYIIYRKFSNRSATTSS